MRMEGNARLMCSYIQMGLTHMARGIFGSLIIYLCGLTVKRIDQMAQLKMDTKQQLKKTVGVKLSFDINFGCQSTNDPKIFL